MEEGIGVEEKERGKGWDGDEYVGSGECEGIDGDVCIGGFYVGSWDRMERRDEGEVDVCCGEFWGLRMGYSKGRDK